MIKFGSRNKKNAELKKMEGIQEEERRKLRKEAEDIKNKLKAERTEAEKEKTKLKIEIAKKQSRNESAVKEKVKTFITELMQVAAVSKDVESFKEFLRTGACMELVEESGMKGAVEKYTKRIMSDDDDDASYSLTQDHEPDEIKAPFEALFT